MEQMLRRGIDPPRTTRSFIGGLKMRKIAIAIAALAIAGFAAPSMQTANAETIVVKKGGHDRDWERHHHKKVVVIKHRRHDHD
jgi:hypothetical protein